MEPRTLREIELWSGLAAAVMGIVVPLFGLIMGSHQVAEVGSILLVIIGLDLGVAAGAMIDSQSGSVQALSTGLALLWSSTMPLVALVFLTYESLGAYIVPAALLALVSAIAGSWADLATRRAAR